MAGSGQQLVQALIFAALDTCPRQLLRTLAAPLRALLDDKAYGNAALGWLSHALIMPDMPGMDDLPTLTRFQFTSSASAKCETPVANGCIYGGQNKHCTLCVMTKQFRLLHKLWYKPHAMVVSMAVVLSKKLS